MAGGRPREYDREGLLKIFTQYVNDTEIPVIAEFAYQNGVPRELLYDWEEFSTVLKQCTAKKETALELGALSGKLNCSMAIFSLKQLGWSDKQETTHKGDAKAPLALVLNGSDVNG